MRLNPTIATYHRLLNELDEIERKETTLEESTNEIQEPKQYSEEHIKKLRRESASYRIAGKDLRKQADYQADYRKRDIPDLMAIQGRLQAVYYTNAATLGNKSATQADESPPPEFDNLLTYLGYERTKVRHTSTTNPEKEFENLSGGQRPKARG